LDDRFTRGSNERDPIDKARRVFLLGEGVEVVEAKRARLQSATRASEK